jgi:methionyl aminopeptidase
MQGSDNLGFHIGHHHGFDRFNAEFCQLPRQPMQVFVLRAAGKDFVADNKNACGWSHVVLIISFAALIKEKDVLDTRPITIHPKEAFTSMRKAGQLAAQVLDAMVGEVMPGVTTDTLNDICHQMILDHGAIAAPLNYKGYPKSICTSVNHVVCHGIPNDKPLKDGDIVNIDVTVIVDGWHGDTSRMYYVGEPPLKAKRLIDVTYEAMMRGIAQVKPGATVGDIGHAIQQFAEGNHYSVVRDYCGHGIGRVFHDSPNILHYGERGDGVRLKEGMFFTVEPMVNIGKPETRLNSQDGWTVTTRDRSLSAQFEHTIGVTADGCEIFTLSPQGLHKPPY